MLLTSILAIGLTIGNIAALPAAKSELEARDTVMGTTIAAYITQLKAAGFIPNAKASVSGKRDLEDVDPDLLKRSTAPNIKTVLDLLATKGFKPATGKKARALDSALASVAKRAILLLPERALSYFAKRALGPLDKRDIPDIGLVISLLELNGFYPSRVKASKRSTPDDEGADADTDTDALELAKRQSAGDINSVINQLMVYGYNPSDFGPVASRLINAYLSQLPVSKTATCPQGNNTIYSDGRNTYQLTCGVGYGGNDLPMVFASSFQACLSSCTNYVPDPKIANGAKCVAASWLPVGDISSDCHRKYAISDISYGITSTNGRQAGRVIAR